MKPVNFLVYAAVKTPVYSIRYNSHFAYLSNERLGWQALINYLGSMMWINIKTEWLTKGLYQ